MQSTLMHITNVKSMNRRNHTLTSKIPTLLLVITNKTTSLQYVRMAIMVKIVKRLAETVHTWKFATNRTELVITAA